MYPKETLMPSQEGKVKLTNDHSSCTNDVNSGSLDEVDASGGSARQKSGFQIARGNFTLVHGAQTVNIFFTFHAIRHLGLKIKIFFFLSRL